jgi:hypothetical protein
MLNKSEREKNIKNEMIYLFIRILVKKADSCSSKSCHRTNIIGCSVLGFLDASFDQLRKFRIDG